MGISNTIPKPGEKVLQKEIETNRRKIRQEVSVSNPDKNKYAPSEIELIQKQVDRFIKTLKLTPQSQQKREAVGKSIPKQKEEIEIPNQYIPNT